MRGVSTPWIIPASTYNEQDFNLSDEIKDRMKPNSLEKQINSKI